MASANGNTVKHWRAVVDASITSESNTSATVKSSCSWQSISWGYSVSGAKGRASVKGTYGSYSSFTASSSTGQTRKIGVTSRSTTITKTHSAQSIKCTAQVVLSGGYHDGTSTATTYITVPAKPSYKVTFNANGGTGAPGQQTKWYGETLTLTTSKPTRTGYSFQGWATSASGSVVYSAGGSYTGNAAVTLYAVWKANTYTVTFDANGGTGAPDAQTKTYDVTLTLSSTIPTRTNYNFKGWGTSSGATTVAYAPGASYTENSAITLYAIWEIAYTQPKVTSLIVDRCTSDGTISDDGTYVKVSFNWSVDETYSGGIDHIQVGYKLSTASSYDNFTTYTLTGMSGSFDQVVGAGALSTENQYEIQITIVDHKGQGSFYATIAPMEYIIDFKQGGTGIAIGKPAQNDGFEIDWDTTFNKKFNMSDGEVVREVLKVKNDATVLASAGSMDEYFTGAVNPTTGGLRLIADGSAMIISNLASGYDNCKEFGFSSDGNIIAPGHLYLPNNGAIAAYNAAGENVISMLRLNASNQVELNWTSGGLKGRVSKEIWSGSANIGNVNLTVPELPYYNVVLAKFSGRSARCIYVREEAGNANSPFFGLSAYTGGSNITFYASAIICTGNKVTQIRSVNANWGGSAAANGTLTSIEGVL